MSPGERVFTAHEAGAAILAAGVGAAFVGTVIGAVALALLERRRRRIDRQRAARRDAQLYRLDWAIWDLAERYRADAGLWEGTEVAAHLEGVRAEGAEHPLDGMRWGLRARITALRLRMRSGGAR